jgi:hypothetical protein
MNNEQVKEFESKLPAALKPGCEVRFWKEDRKHLVCYEIKGDPHGVPFIDEISVLKLRSSQDVDAQVRLISNELPASWID